MQIKVVASSIEPLQLTTDTNLGFAGLAGITNEDPEVVRLRDAFGAVVTMIG